MSLGKKRSKFGRFVDSVLGYGGQERIREVTKLSRDIITKACKSDEYKPSNSTIKLLLVALKELTGRDVKADQFWDM